VFINQNTIIVLSQDKTMEQKDVIKEKLDYFYTNKIKVHLAKYNKEYINGEIIGKVTEDIYLISDEFANETKVFASEVFKVDEWVSKIK